jgi:hypothetical protein
MRSAFAKFRSNVVFHNLAKDKVKMVGPGQNVQEVISIIAKVNSSNA